MGRRLEDVLAELPKEWLEKIQARTDEMIRDSETRQALKSVEAGHFIEGDKVFEWLDSWGTDDIQETPSCDD